MKKVLISGYYGFGNTGDEAILTAMISSLRSEIPNIKITVASANPQATETRYGVKTIPRSVREVRRTLKTTDLFISGGGGLLQDVTSFKSLAYYCLLLMLARLERVPVMIYGQGIGPLRRRLSRFLTRLAVSGCDTIAVRDERSKVLLEEIGVRRDVVVTADPALLLKPAQVARLNGIRRPAVGFALRAWQGIDFDKVAKAADEIAERLGGTAVFIPFHDGRDTSVAEQIAGRMKSQALVVSDAELPAEVLGLVGELDVLVGMRLHSTIFAAISGVPFVPISYDPKLEEFAFSIGAMNPIPSRSMDVGAVVAGVENVLSLNSRLNGGWNYQVEELRLQARQNAALARQLLKERRVLGIRFDALEMDEAAESIERCVEERKPRLIVTLNAEMMVMAKGDPSFKAVLEQADLLIPDSVGITWAGKLRARVPGIDMVDELARRAAAKGYRIFMIGSKPGVAKKAAAKLAAKYPGLRVVGTHSGYFSKTEEEGLIEEIRAAQPDILFVGLGMGKQEKWIAGHLRGLDVPACLGVGGSFDVIAGEVRRAPVWVRQAGLEWLYRLVSQPTRFKRILALPKFVYMVVRERGVM